MPILIGDGVTACINGSTDFTSDYHVKKGFAPNGETGQRGNGATGQRERKSTPSDSIKFIL
jgi:hypothetical protein